MKVICVKKPKVTLDGQPLPSPEVGDEDTVTGDRIYQGDVFYYLERFGDTLSYLSTYFARISDLDETALVTEAFEEKYCEPLTHN